VNYVINDKFWQVTFSNLQLLVDSHGSIYLPSQIHFTLPSWMLDWFAWSLIATLQTHVLCSLLSFKKVNLIFWVRFTVLVVFCLILHVNTTCEILTTWRPCSLIYLILLSTFMISIGPSLSKIEKWVISGN